PSVLSKPTSSTNIYTLSLHDALPIFTNIDVKMVRNSSKGPFGVGAEVTNPNDFAVKDVRVRCTMEDDKGNKLIVYDSTILATFPDRKSTRLNSSHGSISYAVFCLKKK